MKIIDVCCGTKMFWYDKREKHTTYMDIRKEIVTFKDRNKERFLKLILISLEILEKYPLMLTRLI